MVTVLVMKWYFMRVIIRASFMEDVQVLLVHPSIDLVIVIKYTYVLIACLLVKEQNIPTLHYH